MAMKKDADTLFKELSKTLRKTVPASLEPHKKIEGGADFIDEITLMADLNARDKPCSCSNSLREV